MVNMLNLSNLIDDEDEDIDLRTRIDRDYVFTFGQYKGETVKEVMSVDAKYFQYLDKTGDFLIDEGILKDSKNISAKRSVKERINNWLDEQDC